MAYFCSACGTRTGPQDRFCEVCGARLSASKVHGGVWRSSAASPSSCPVCDGSYDPDGYCADCGRRRTASRDRAELALTGVAAVTCTGPNRKRNEDAVAIGRLDDPGWTVAVVCDGISSSLRADDAAIAGAEAAVVALLRHLGEGDAPALAVRQAHRAAQAAVAGLAGPGTAHNAPACTFVAGVVGAGSITVGWVGDSRAYWVPAGGPARQLTDDDATGGGTSPHSAPLTRWLGADAGPLDVRLTTVDSVPAGVLVLCSDGLSRYLAHPEGLTVVRGAAPGAAARTLADFAVEAGGADNIAVAIAPFPGTT
jgi:serine/threonine protein phosphatase PrpC